MAQGHNLQPFGRKMSKIQWERCVWCGLLALRNDKTRRLLWAPCPGKDYDIRAVLTREETGGN